MGNNLTIKMSLQDNVSSKLSQVSSAARSAASQLQQIGRQIDNAFRTVAPEQFAGRLGNAVDAAAGRVDSLGNSIGRALEEMEHPAAADMGERLEDAAEGARELSEAANDAGESTRELSEDAEDLAGAAERLGESLRETGENSDEILDDLPDDAEEAGESMERAQGKADSLADALKSLFAVVSAAVVLHEIGSFASEAVELGKGFTSMVSEVQAISGASASDMEKLEQTAREYGATTVFSASEAAEALKYMSLAGWDANQSASALGGVLNLAAASGMGLGQASDMVTDYLSAFGMEASQAAYFADMLSYAQSSSNTTAEALGEAYRNSAANMHAAGQDVETTTSLLEAMANQGYKGSEAGTALAAVMRDITQKMEDGAVKIGKTSVSVQDTEGNFRDLTDILTEVESATCGMGDAQKAAALGTTFTADSIKAMNMILTEGMNKISGYEEELRNAGGTAENMAGIMNDNLSGDMANMNSAYEEMKLQVFEQMEDPLRDGVQYITSTAIPALTEWVPDAFGALAEGAAKLGNALKPLFETVLKNPQAIAGAFSSLGAGFLAMKSVSGAMKIGKNISDGIAGAGSIGGALSKLASSVFGNPWAAGAAAVAAAVTAIGLAVHSYNQMQVNDSLEKHFGNIELDESQIQDFAGHVIHADWLVDVNAALGHFENADKLAEEAEKALADNDALEWKAEVGMALTEDDKESYAANIDTFLQAGLDELEERTYAAELSISTILRTADGKSLADHISQWAAQDMADASAIQRQLTNLVEDALTDGIIDVNEQEAINILQGKINNILSGWKSSEAQAEMDLITQQYGRLSGKDLTADTFTSIVEAFQQQRESAAEAMRTMSLEALRAVNALIGPGRLSENEGEDFKNQIAQAARNEEALTLVNSLDFEGNTLSDTYGEKLKENQENIQRSTEDFLKLTTGYLEDLDYETLRNTLQNGYKWAMEGTDIFSGADQKALSKLYETMKPDATAMEELIDEYAMEGQKVPEAVAEAFHESIQIGAAAGDADAGWAVFAQQMVADPASEALVDAIQDGTVAVPEELSSALARAVALSAENVTDEPIRLENVSAEVQKVSADYEKVQELLDNAMDGLEYTGESLEFDAGEIAAVYQVTAGQSVDEIAAQAGMAVNDLLAANPELAGQEVVTEGMTINIPVDRAEVDASEIGKVAEEARKKTQEEVDKATSEPVQGEQKAEIHTTYETFDDDKSALEAANESAETETVKRNVSVSYQVADVSIDDASLASALQSSIDGCTANLSYDSVTSAVGSGIAAAVQASIGTIQEAVGSLRTKVGDAIDRAFSAGFRTRTNVTITADYKLANPTANISFSGGGSGTASVKAALHADGGYFEQPHLGIVAEAGGEYIIPMDGSSRSRDMWMDAGKMLGIDGGASAAAQPKAMAGEIGKPVTASGPVEKTINLNINGKGSLQVRGGGVSKQQIAEAVFENVREALMSIIIREITEEGEGSYEF